MIRDTAAGCLGVLAVLLMTGCGEKSKSGATADPAKPAAPGPAREASRADSPDTPRESKTLTPRKPRKPPGGRSPEVEEAVQAIKKLGGVIVLEDKTIPESPIIGVTFHNSGVTGEKLEPLTKIPNLREVRLGCYRLTDISYACKCGDLRTLLLKGSGKIGDDALQPLAGLHRLETLSLPTFITDSGLRHVQKLTTLTHLDLGGNQKITDTGLDNLSGLKNLTHLTLSRMIGNAGLSRLPALTSLESLNCSETYSITNDGLRHLAGMTSLRELNLQGQLLTDAGLEHLHGLKNLRTLKLSRAARKVTDQAVIRLKQAIPGLEVSR